MNEKEQVIEELNRKLRLASQEKDVNVIILYLYMFQILWHY